MDMEMTTDYWLTILQWLLGGGIGGTLVWFATRKARKAETEQREQTAWEAMRQELTGALQSVQEECARLYVEVVELRKDNGTLQATVARLERAVRLVNTCIHRSDCPVRRELPDTGAKYQERRGDRNHTGHRGKTDAGGREEKRGGGGGRGDDTEDPGSESEEPP